MAEREDFTAVAAEHVQGAVGTRRMREGQSMVPVSELAESPSCRRVDDMEGDVTGIVDTAGLWRIGEGAAEESLISLPIDLFVSPEPHEHLLAKQRDQQVTGRR